LAVRTRRLLLAAFSAAAGVAAVGTVLAQQPLSGYGQPVGQPGTFQGTTVKPYNQWTPNGQAGGVQPAGGYLPNPPPGYTPVNQGGNRPRLTQPVMAGPDGVRPAGGIDLPPPNMDIPAFRSGPGAAPPGTPAPTTPPGRPLPPPNMSPDVGGESKFGPVGPPPDPRSAVPPTLPGNPGAPPVPPTGVALPPPSMTTIPTPPGGPRPLPQVGPATPANPPTVVPVFTPPPGDPATPSIPAVPTAPGAPAAPPAVATPVPAQSAVGLLPGRVTPAVSVETLCPDSVVFGQEFKYTLIVRNTGSAAVSYVRVEDELPAAARYVGSDPPAELNGDRLVWGLGTMEPNSERRLEVRVKPGEEGDVRSRAVVTFAAAVDARTRVTRPRVAVAVAGAEVCRAGEETTFQIKLTNSGSGPATRMVLQARLTDGLLHPQGMVIEAELANLPPGESKTVPLRVSATKSGLQACQIVVAAEGSPDATAKASVNVVEPMLQVSQTGPVKCHVRAEPVYTIEMTNPGTSGTDPVQLTSVLPDGFEYVQASDGGTFNPDSRAVCWRLPALPAGSTRAVTLKLRAIAATEGLLRTVAQTGAAPAPNGPAQAGAVAVRPTRGLEAKAETVVTAEGVAAVRFEVVGLENPVEIGKEAVYEIRVMNQGTGPCSNVQLVAALAEGTTFVGATQGVNQANVRATGQQLVFDPIPTLGVKGDAVYRVRVRGTVAGDMRFRAQITCDQLKAPVAKEESTQFYKE
jgi:uncharacterized repeat protein (TIGR01451 family)